MFSPRWRKVLRDLWQNRGRALLVIFAIALGVFGVSWISSSYAVLTRELRSEYLSVNPASFTLVTDTFDETLIQEIAALPGVGQVEGARTVDARLQTGTDEWRVIKLFIVPDYLNNEINQINPQTGTFSPTDGEILIERAALQVAHAEIGDTLRINVPGAESRDLRVAGTVHDLNQAPAWQEGVVYGYVTQETLGQFGLSSEMTELQVVVADNYFDLEHVQDVAGEVKAWLESQGYPVYQIRIPPPGKHVHQDQMDSLLLLQQSFGVLALLLSGVLTANMISALLSQQIRQIGIIKTLGGTNRQVMGIYFSTVLILGAVALLIALPLGLGAGRGYTAFVAAILNFNVRNSDIPAWVVAVQIGIGLGVPLLAAAYPIYRGSRITVYEAIRDYGLAEIAFGGRLIDQLLARLQGLARPVLLSIRNTFRRQGRLILTLATLSVGGATFMAALNLNTSLLQTLEGRFGALNYDIDLRLDRMYPLEKIEAAALAVPGVDQVETLATTTASAAFTDGTYSSIFRIYAPPDDSQMVNFPLIAGRWLVAGDENAIAINHTFQAKIMGLDVGDSVELRVNGQETSWQIVGVYREVAGEPAVTMRYANLTQLLGQADRANALRIVTVTHDETALQAAKSALEGRFDAAGLSILTNNSVFDGREVLEEHSVVLVTFMMLMTFLSVVVGGLGLATTMSINVVERTREIGILRAVGASTGALLTIVLSEGALIGALSWVLAVVLTVPVSYLFGSIFGTTLLETPLDFMLNPVGMGVWLLVVIVFSLFASLLPAWNAASLTVQNVLAYE